MSNVLLETKQELSLKRIATDGGLLSVLLGSIVMGSLAYHAEIWHDDYPPDLQEKAGPMSKRAKRERLVVAVPFLALLLGGPVFSNRRLRQQNGGKLSLPAAAANAYAIWSVFNLFDLLVLDYAILMGLKPRFAILPGTQGTEKSYQDYKFHFIGFLKGQSYGLVLSLIIAFVMSRKQSKHL